MSGENRPRVTPFVVSISMALFLAGCSTNGSAPATPAPSAAAPVPSVQPSPTSTTIPATTTALPATATAPADVSTPVSSATSTVVAAPATATTAGIVATSAAVATQVVPTQGAVQLPPGFAISVYAQGLQLPRMMALGPDHQLYVAERGAGRIIRLPDHNGDGIADGIEAVATGLSDPTSIAFYQDGSLYVGESYEVIRLSAPDQNGVFQKREVIVPNLPTGGEPTRTVLFSPDWKTLFVSIGAPCNVCQQSDPLRAAITRYDPDGSHSQTYASGLRNAVGITFRPGTGELWATNNGRDYMGDNLPPDTVNLVHQGDNYGWPSCHAGTIVDPQFGTAGACNGVAQPAVNLQAHSAPLGLTFYTGQQFPADYQGNLFVAFHGSWNRTVPTGYKVVRIPMNGDKPGAVEDFATGWLLPDGSHWGRPVDALTAPDGSLLVSDDAGGTIYRIFYTGK